MSGLSLASESNTTDKNNSYDRSSSMYGLSTNQEKLSVMSARSELNQYNLGVFKPK